MMQMILNIGLHFGNCCCNDALVLSRMKLMDRCNAIIQRMVELMIGYCLNELEIYITSFSDEVGLWNRIPERTQYIIHLIL